MLTVAQSSQVSLLAEGQPCVGDFGIGIVHTKVASSPWLDVSVKFIADHFGSPQPKSRATVGPYPVGFARAQSPYQLASAEARSQMKSDFIRPSS